MNYKLVITIIVVILLVVLAGLFVYLYSTGGQQSAGNKSEDTIEKISDDINQIPNESSANQQLNSFGDSVESF